MNRESGFYWVSLVCDNWFVAEYSEDKEVWFYGDSKKCYLDEDFYKIDKRKILRNAN